jgi:hypothetical protein
MAFEYQGRMAIPLWAVAFITVALTAPPTATLFLLPPTTVFAIAAVGIATIFVMMPDAITRLRPSRSPARVAPSGYPEPASARLVVAAGTCVRKLDEPNAIDAEDALDLVRMDDDGGWQMTRPPA